MPAMAKKTKLQQAAADGAAGAPVRDLVDFYFRWPEFRTVACRLQANRNLTPEERNALHWLVALADRVSEHDLETDRS
jgi:hypothetical protein